MKKVLLRITITTIFILGVFVSIPLILSVLNKGEIAADIHKIEKASSPYLYKYHSSTFDLLAGEKNNDPRVTLVQGKRSLDINIKPAEQKPAPKPTQTEPAPTTQPEDTTEEPTPPTDTTEPEPVEEPTPPSPEETSFLPIGSVQASESVTVINPTTKPAIEYVNGSTTSDVVITPNQQKVVLTFDIEGPPKNLPSLTINPKKMVLKQNGDEIVFTTRTTREAFALKNAGIRDKNGAKTSVDLILSSISKDNFTITLKINSGWFSDSTRVYPITLSVDTVSLFHERMVTASPTKPDFAATEKPEFIIDISEVEEPLRSALINRDYSKLTIGAIDASGQGRQISSELTPTGNGDLKLRFTVGGSSIKPGLYDLLIQYGDDPSFIGEEEFSWGVLAMNPDQAVYKPGQEARIDMAVLDRLGRMVCDAALNLEITNPAGKSTSLSTHNGRIIVSDECKKKKTELPDYTTTYNVAAAGNYNMKLTATTENGTFTITDKFIVDPDSPFYVKRSGPTRIYPPITYTMSMTIEANKSVSKIVETVPSNFEIEDSPEFTLSKDGKQTLTWNKKLKKGDQIDISYKFNAPHISPALFFIGPAQIGSWQEPRVWQIASDAITIGTPSTCAADAITCTISAYDASGTDTLLVVGVSLDDSDNNKEVTSITHDGTNLNNLLDIDGGGNKGHVEVWYLKGTSTTGDLVVTINGGNAQKMAVGAITYTGVDQTTPIDTGTVQTNTGGNCSSGTSVTVTTESGDVVADVVTWQNQPLDGNQADQTEQWDLEMTGSAHNGGGSTQAGADGGVMSWGGLNGSCGQIGFNINQVVTGPTNAQLMRHGKWFDGSSAPEQPMTF